MQRLYNKVQNKAQKLFLLILVSIFLAILIYLLTHHSTPYVPAVSIHCIGATQTFTCEKRHVEVITRALGPKVAMGDLKKQFAHTGEVVSDCHQLAHAIGNTAAELYGGNITKAFLNGDSFCWSGYYHGVVERAVENIGALQFMASANTLCANIPGKERYSFDYYNCVHGLGHGLMALTHNELFKTLSMCDQLSGDWERKSCYGGTFMENIMVDNRNHYAKYLKKDDLMYPCNAVDAKYKEQCYLMQTSHALSQTNYDFANAFKLCAGVDADFRDTCAQSVGRDASGNSVSDPVRTNAHCALAQDDNQFKNCVTGAVKDFISYFHRDKEARQFCFTLPERFRLNCLETGYSYLRTL